MPEAFTVTTAPQWSPGLMAGGRPLPSPLSVPTMRAAMEPRPDGRGKVIYKSMGGKDEMGPQWSPGLMAGGRAPAHRGGRPSRSAAMEPRPDGRGKPALEALNGAVTEHAAMEPRPDGRGKGFVIIDEVHNMTPPQWSPGLMAGGSRPAWRRRCQRSSPQWSPGLMAGGRAGGLAVREFRSPAAMEPRPDGRGKMLTDGDHVVTVEKPQWSPGLMAGGRQAAT